LVQTKHSPVPPGLPSLSDRVPPPMSRARTLPHVRACVRLFIRVAQVVGIKPGVGDTRWRNDATMPMLTTPSLGGYARLYTPHPRVCALWQRGGDGRG
jgi:hypothetical protein